MRQREETPEGLGGIPPPTNCETGCHIFAEALVGRVAVERSEPQRNSERHFHNDIFLATSRIYSFQNNGSVAFDQRTIFILCRFPL